MLQKQKISDNDHCGLPLIYSVNGHTFHFGRREFCLISGFKFGFLSFRKFREGDITFHDRVFLEKIGEYLKNIDLLSLIEDEYRFSSLSDPDSIRVCLLLSLEVIFMGHELGSAVDDVFLKMVEDLDVWNDFPWGEHMWRELYGAIRNVNLNHQQGHHKALEMNPNFVPTYSLSRFLLSFKIWILESSCVTDRWWCKRSEEIPRGCSRSKHLPFQNWENYGQLFPEAKKQNCDLYPNKCEAQSEWFKRSTGFFKMYTPRAPPVEYGGLFGAYLKKLSLARTRRKKDGDAESGTDIAKISRKRSKLDKYEHGNGRAHKEPENAIKNALIRLDDKRLGWLLNDHIELWVWYMWHFRQSCHDWSIVSCYFLTLLLQDSWRDVEQVFIPINEPKRHWSLAQFHIQSGNVTFYDSQNIEGVEYRPWYLKMRSCLETKMPVLLHRTGVFASKGIDPNSYSIKFSQEQNVPQQGGLFGDCGVFVCLFLYRLAHGIPLAVEDPIQMALAYREKMVKFYFEHKIICPS
ncbi:phospholipase-like, aminotransferase-like mobile domain protein [Tanacetum coccineum]